MSNYEVIHLPERERFELLKEGEAIGYLQASKRGDTLIMPYIEIDRAHRGMNLSSVLLKRALEIVMDKGFKVRALCPVVAAFLRRHTEFRQLQAG